jgi:predicted DsbA family dithiol-disulfide isomerase
LRHLEIASQNSGIKVNLEWLPFLLNPNVSEEGEDIKEHLLKKYGPAAMERFNDPNSHLKVMGRKVGIEFTDDRKVVDTKRAHALMEHLKAKGENDKANEFMVDLYKAYFEKGEDINNVKLLTEKVQKYGLDETEAQFAMGDHNLAEIAKQDRKIKSMYGVSGVPFFMIHPNDGGRPVAFSGAYPPEVIAEQLEEAADA